ncbi:DUF4421 family protein [Flavobacterium seoulense]|uniref:DUF4421 domain-containing protein n=1 Tax=Flavobacterium seoulense TaxID=1492738 RepID=A0A066WQY9_9FLAO|nr:DUF4421 family protein [Flavobacterium seoulense]KDN56462.1 hypothetical protein FEM21_04810 [Flavobacterium seoulense]
MRIRFIFLLIVATSWAQQKNTDSISNSTPANEYIIHYDDFIKTRVGFTNSFNSFHIKDQKDNLDFTLSPNQRLRSTFTFMYKFIELDLGYTPDFIRFNKDDEKYGKTSFSNFGTRLYLGKWMQSIEYTKIKGFYVNKDDIGIPENLLFSNFQMRRFGGSTSYIFNPNFSFRTIFGQSEWQKKSAGSFVPSISYYFTQMKNDNPSKDNSIDIAVGPGYYYNWVINKNLLISAGAYGGVGYNTTKTTYSDGTPEEIIDGLSYQTQLNLNLGYNSEKFYTGVTARWNTFYYDNDPRVHIKDQQRFFEFYVGYRFKASERISNLVNNPQSLIKKK